MFIIKIKFSDMHYMIDWLFDICLNQPILSKSPFQNETCIKFDNMKMRKRLCNSDDAMLNPTNIV